jgi:glycosyltransferase involved in cell wall biosynthesis
VAHLPARTPYARKLAGGGLTIVNSTSTPQAPAVPQDMSFRWLREQPSFDFFDVLHVHSVELAADQDIEAVLDRCERDGKRVVCTIHDVTPMFSSDEAAYAEQLRMLADRKISLITLTEGAATALRHALGPQHPVTVVPHGQVLPLDDPRWRTQRAHPDGDSPTRFAMYGGFRPNRYMFPVVANLLFGTLSRPASVSILTRAVSPVELDTNRDLGAVINAALARPERVDLRLSPFPHDDEIADFLLSADALVLPYRWGTHSGQLELAFDLGIVPVVADVGYLREQWQRYEGVVPEPIWFDWTDDYQQGTRILAALQHAIHRQHEWAAPRHDLHALRTAEHQATLTAHHRLYTETR